MTVQTTSNTHDRIIAERAEHRAFLVRMLANERGKLKPATKRIDELQKEADKLRPRVETLAKWAAVEDQDARLHLPAARQQLDDLERQLASWTSGRSQIQKRIPEFEEAIKQHDAEKVDDLHRGELAAVLDDISKERRADAESDQRRMAAEGQMYKQRAEEAERLRAARVAAGLV